jgi:hypothetical protein
MKNEVIRNATLQIQLDVSSKAAAIEAAVARYRAAKVELDLSFVELANCMEVSVVDLLLNGRSVGAA